jgi:membrane protease YdiL (CAAX protease family)
VKLSHPFLNAGRKLRNGWWVAIFFLLLAALLVPLIIAADGAGVPIAAQAGIVALASVICQLLRRKPLSEMLGALNWRWLRDLGLGCALGAALMLAPALALVATGFVRLTQNSLGFDALAPGLALFAAVAVAEELTFRGFVFQRFLDGLGEWPAQLIMAALFALTHSDALAAAGPLGYLAGANIFLASIMFGLAFIRTRSLALPLGLHFAANFTQGTVLGFGVSGEGETGMLRPILAEAPDWLTGGTFGLEASVPGFVCVLLATLLLLRWPQRV